MDKINPGIVIRLCKASLVAAMGLLLGLVAFGNIVNYGDRALALPVAGLTVAMLLYGAGFVAVGGEWFLMWQSRSWSGSDAAARFFLLNAIVLIVLLAGRAPAGAEP